MSIHSPSHQSSTAHCHLILLLVTYRLPYYQPATHLRLYLPIINNQPPPNTEYTTLHIFPASLPTPSVLPFSNTHTTLLTLIHSENLSAFMRSPRPSPDNHILHVYPASHTLTHSHTLRKHPLLARSFVKTTTCHPIHNYFPSTCP